MPAIVGRRIDALEERLGVKLLTRSTRSLALTQEGAAFYEDCQRILADLADAEAAVASGSGARAAICGCRHRPVSAASTWRRISPAFNYAIRTSR